MNKIMECKFLKKNVWVLLIGFMMSANAQVINDVGKFPITSLDNLFMVVNQVDDDFPVLIDGQLMAKKDFFSIKSNDIESFIVIGKDQATSIWGDKGKNGAISIDTKPILQCNVKVLKNTRIFATPEKPAICKGGKKISDIFKQRLNSVASDTACTMRISYNIDSDGQLINFRANVLQKNHIAEYIIYVNENKISNNKKNVKNDYMKMAENVYSRLKKLGTWTPAKHGGENVVSAHTFTVAFIIEKK